MTRDELEKRNVGENLDALMNLDPRGYGVCRILYAGSRAYTGEPLTMHAAQVLCDAVKENDLVYIITGFVLLPHKVPEMDGTVSSMLLARALVMAFGAKPVIICPADSVQAIEKCAAVVGLVHLPKQSEAACSFFYQMNQEESADLILQYIMTANSSPIILMLTALHSPKNLVKCVTMV